MRGIAVAARGVCHRSGKLWPAACMNASSHMSVGRAGGATDHLPNRGRTFGPAAPWAVGAATLGLACLGGGGVVALESSPPISITSNFDSGNIELVNVKGTQVDLNIRREPFTEGTDKTSHAQWYHFKAANVKGKNCTFRILNAGKCSYAPGFVGYRSCCSYDRKNWFRVPTEYSEKDGVMTISLTPQYDNAWFAYFAPFSYEEHELLIARCAESPLACVRSLGHTLDGRDLDLITVGTGKTKAWCTARQHPGESMAEHWMDGLLARLLDPDDALAKHLRTLCTFYVVPNANPDGSIRGHLRTNACGANLNREWASSPKHYGNYKAPTMERSPEFFLILQEMDKTGVDFFVDVHGDEELPHNFFAATQGASNWNAKLAILLQRLAEAYQSANPDFGDLAYNYGNDEVGDANPTTADTAVSLRFGCLAVTLEQPFKDCYTNPEPKYGWSPARSRRLGASFLDALAAVVDDLRRDFTVDESSLKPWVKPGYPCPPATECTWK
mmetsp:Transcript_28129/g.51425  ORF Transcript_28129/g.51425 Transcript_28129/m.51425 type:complete len:500 (+) Transcript_28129:66-1565(+)